MKQLEEEPPLEDRMAKLERWQKDHELMHDEWYGKMRRVLARINRARAQEEEEIEQEPATRAPFGSARAEPISVFEAKQRLGIRGGQ